MSCIQWVSRPPGNDGTCACGHQHQTEAVSKRNVWVTDRCTVADCAPHLFADPS